MGWQNFHLHVFAHGREEYGDNARDETAVTLAGLLPRPGGRMVYRYDFSHCWDHSIEVEKIHQEATKTIYLRYGRCRIASAGKYQAARELFGTAKWDRPRGTSRRCTRPR